MKNTDLSIIIPVYNAQDYISRCLISLRLQQGFDRYEVIFVDDGSTDDTKKSLDLFNNAFPNVRVIYQDKNCGVSVARNVGIDAAHGKFVTFFDPDDMVGANIKAFDNCFDKCPQYNIGRLNITNTTKNIPTCLDFKHFSNKYFVNMLKIAKKERADVVLGGKIEIDRHADTPYMRRFVYDSTFVYGPTPKDKEIAFYEANESQTANFTLYNRDMLNAHDLRFVPNMDLDEDILFRLLAILHAKKVATAPDVTYMYIRHPGTLSYSTDTDSIQEYRTIISNIQLYSNFLYGLSQYPEYDSTFYLHIKPYIIFAEEYHQFFPAAFPKCIADCGFCREQKCKECPARKEFVTLLPGILAKYNGR